MRRRRMVGFMVAGLAVGAGIAAVRLGSSSGGTTPAGRPASGTRLPASRTRHAAASHVDEIAPDVFWLASSGRTQTNVYLVRSGSSWALVDTGWESDAGRIAAAARSLLGPDVSPASIILTHVHPDHSGSARALAEAWRCPVLVHPAEVAIARGDFAAMERYAGPLDRWVILPAMRAIGAGRRAALLARGSLAGFIEELEPDGSLAGLDRWRWIHTPGHTPGHISLVRSDDHVVLTGDALLTLLVNAPGGIVLGRQGLSAPPWYTTWDPRAAARSIATIAALEACVLGGGHGRPLTGPDIAPAIRTFSARISGGRSLGVPLGRSAATRRGARPPTGSGATRMPGRPGRSRAAGPPMDPPE